MTEDQREYESAIRGWLSLQGYEVLARAGDPLVHKLRAARECDVCVVLLGSTFGPRDPLSSFSHTELEVAAAADAPGEKIIVFLERDADQTASPEQREFIERLRNFVTGVFQGTVSIPEELVHRLAEALAHVRPPAAHEPGLPDGPPSNAIMISSTGSLSIERAAVRAVLQHRGIAPIDYQQETSAAATPRTQVIAWARQCRALVLIVGARYGFVSPVDGLSVTELEFVTALQAGRPIIALIAGNPSDTGSPDLDADQIEDAKQFRARIEIFTPPERIVQFMDVSELPSLLAPALDQLPAPSPAALGLAAPTAAPAVAADLAHRWYRRQVHRWLGTIPHLTQPRGMPLNHVYVGLRVRAPTHRDDQLESDSAKQAHAHSSEQEGPQPQQTVDVDRALRRFPRLLLRGNPGSGKTSVLRWYAISAPDNVTPVFIRLAAYARALQDGSVTSLPEFISLEQQRLMLASSDDHSDWLGRIQAGQAIVLLDALDEVSRQAQEVEGARDQSLQNRVRRDILALATQAPLATPIVVTTRIAGIDPRAFEPTFTVADVQPLDVGQQTRLVKHWLRAAHANMHERGGAAVGNSAPWVGARTEQIMRTLLRNAQLSEWARTPLMLTLLTALADAAPQDFAGQPLTPAMLFRRALRLILGQWGTLTQRRAGRNLWLKEQLLVALARANLEADRREIFTSRDVANVWSQLAADGSPDTLEKLLADLSQGDGFLTPLGEQDGLTQYAFYHPMFQAYMGATWLAALLASERESRVSAARLNADWEEPTTFLVGELDRLGRQADADSVVRALMRADARPLQGHRWPDPTRLALRRAAACQGGRAPEWASNAVGQELAQAWARMLLRDYKNRTRGFYTLKGIGQALRALGPAAMAALPDLRTTIAQYHPARVAVLEVLGELERPEPEEYIESLWPTRYNDEESLALIRALRRRSQISSTTRDILFREVTSTSGDVARRIAAAEMLCQFDLRLQEDDTLLPLPDDVRAATLRVAYLLPAPEARRIVRDELSAFAAANPGRGAEARAAAIETLDQFGDGVESLVDPLIRIALMDVSANQQAAEAAIIGLGPRAAPALRRWLEDNPLELRARVRLGLSTGRTEAEWARELASARQAQEQIRVALEHWRSTHDLEAESLVRQLFASYRHVWAEGSEGQTTTRQYVEGAPAVERFLADIRRYSPDQAKGELLALGPTGADVIEALCAELTSDLSGMWNTPLEYLRKLGPLAGPAIPRICALMETRAYSASADVRVAVLRTLKELPAMALPASAMAMLQATLRHDPQWQPRTLAVEVVGRMRDAAQPVLPDLRAVLRDRHMSFLDKLRDNDTFMVRRAAVRALADLWPLSAAAFADITDALLTDPSVTVRAAAAEALGRIGAAAQPALDALEHALHARKNWPFEEVRIAAFNALGRVLATVDDAG